MDRFFFILQYTLICGSIAAAAFFMVQVPEIVLGYPFPSFEIEKGSTIAIIFFLFAIIFYVLVAFRKEEYWQRLSTVFLFLATLFGVFYCALLFSFDFSFWVYYLITFILVICYYTFSITLIHTAVQCIGAIGIIVFLATHLSFLQIIFFFLLFSLYDTIAAFFPQQLFSVVARLFDNGHHLSLLFPKQFSDWFSSYTEISYRSIRVLDIIVPVCAILFLSYGASFFIFSLLTAGYLVGLFFSIFSEKKVQSRLLYPLCGVFCGYGIGLFF